MMLTGVVQSQRYVMINEISRINYTENILQTTYMGIKKTKKTVQNISKNE